MAGNNIDSDKQFKSKSKLFFLKKLQLHGQQKQQNVYQQQQHPTSNNSTGLSVSATIHRDVYTSRDKNLNHVIFESGWSDGCRSNKTSLDGCKGEKKKESKLHKFFLQRSTSRGTSTPSSDRTHTLTSVKTNASEDIQEKIPPPKIFRDEESINDQLLINEINKFDRHKTYLPIVEIENKSTEKPLGIVFLTFRDETKRSLLPNEITSLSTIWALFVRSFPDGLTMNWFEATRVTIYILNPFTKLYCPLRNLKEIRDKSALKIFEEEAMLKSKNLMTSPYQQWRRYDSCRSSAQSIGTPHTKDLPISNQFPNQKINSNRSIRNDIMRSAPPISRELIYPDNGIYKSLFLQDPSSSSPSSSLLPAQTSSSLLPPSSSSSSSLNFVIRHESLQSSTSTNSDVSQATIVRSPYISSASLNPNKNNTNNTNNTNQITNNNTEAYNHRTANKHSDVTMETKVLKLKEQTHILQKELDQLKQLQQKHVTTMKESILEATSKCEELLTSVNKNLTRDRSTIDVQKSGYSDDVGVVEAKLKGLEFSIEELKNEVLTRRGSIKINEINKLAHLLNQVAKLLTELKIRLQILQTTIKPLILSEIVTVINDEKFVRGEPNRLDILLNRCKHLATILTTLKKLALAQENAKPASSLPQHSINCQIVSQPFTETSSCNPTPPRLKSTTNVIERSQSQQQIPTQQSVSIPSQSIDNLDQFKVNGNHHFDQFYRKVLNPQQNIDNDAYLFFMQNLYSIYTGTPFSQSSSSLARGETRVNRSLAPEVQETQSAPTTPMMVGARIPNVHFNHGCLLKNGSDISLAPSTESSRYSSPMSSESNMKRLFDTSSMNQLTDQFNRKHRQNVLFHPGYSDIGHLRNELLNELLFNSSTQINKSQLRNIGAISDSEDNFVGENHPTQFSVHDKQQQNSTKYCNLYTSLYKMLDENINKQQQQQQQNTIMSTTATTASASCLHCSTEESESPIKHKADCPLQIHEAILRFSKANSDLEMGLCAKLSRDHLQEKLKIRQDQLKKQNNDDK